MNYRKQFGKSVLLAGAALTAVAQPALAQDAEGDPVADSETVFSNQIVVTASKREELLFDVGGSISAIGGEELSYRNLEQVEDFAAQIPGFNFQPGGNRQVRLILRGLNSGGNGATTAVIIDETPLSYQSGATNGSVDTANLDTFDMARIEVLKGPQGTLYGATSQGGLLKYVTNAPELDRIALSAEIGTEFVDKGGTGYFGRGMINYPLINDVLAVRATGFYQKVPGFIDNPLIGVDNANDGERWGGRISVLFKPSDVFSLRVTGSRQDQEFDDNGTLEVVGSNLTPFDPPANEFAIANGGRREQNSLLGNPSRNRYEYINATATLDLGFAELLSSTSFGHLSTRFTADITSANPLPGLPLTFGTLLAGFYGEPIAVQQVQENSSDRTNQEFRLTSKPDSTLLGLKADWQVGAFYAKETVTFPQGFDVVSVATGDVLTVPFPGGSLEAPADYKEYAGFGSVTLYLTDDVDITFGGRYTDSRQTAKTIYYPGFATGPVLDETELVVANESKWTYSGALRWRFNEDSLLYGRIASGYRPGGPNRITPGGLPADIPRSYAADNTVNYELGLRTSLFDDSFTVDVAAFYIDWTDIQILTTFRSETTGQNITVVGNAGTARSKGLEWAFAWTPIQGLRLSSVGSHTDAKLTETRPLLGGEDGDQLPFVPRWTNTVNVDYETGLTSDAEGFIGASWTYSSGAYTGFVAEPAAYPDHVKLPSYHTFNMQAGVRINDIDVSLYVRNLANDKTLTSYSQGNGYNFTGLGQILQPRTIGIKLGVRY